MSGFAETLLALPAGQWLPLGLLVVVGLALWAAGNRLLRPVFGLTGLLVGLGAGWIVADALHLGVPRWAAMGVLGFVCAALAFLAYRTAIAAGLALVLGVAAPVSLWSFAEVKHAPPEAAEVLGTPETEMPGTGRAGALDELDAWLDQLAGRALDRLGGADVATEEAQSASAAPAEHRANTEDPKRAGFADLRSLLDGAATRVTDWWGDVPANLQAKLMAAGAIGAIVGFLFGTLASTLSASLVTACLGAGAWMSGGWSAVTRLGGPDPGWLPATPTAWLTWWLLISIIGLLIQWTLWPKRADTAG